MWAIDLFDKFPKCRYFNDCLVLLFSILTSINNSIFFDKEMGPETANYHKVLAEKIANKKEESYAEVITYIRTMLSNIAIKSSLLCLRGSRKCRSQDVQAATEDFSLINSELSLN